jgi:magnesium transporter
MSGTARMGRGKASRAAGLPPGTLAFFGEKRVENVIVSLIDYNETQLHETPIHRSEDCGRYINKDTVSWFNVTGLHDTKLLEELGNIFGFHPLILEDILQTGQRPKIEDHEDYIFCVLQMMYRHPADGEIMSEQVSMILGPGYLFTFQEVEGDVFDMLRDRIRTGKGRIRKMGCDYLAYAIIDAIVDNYFVVLEDLSEKCEALQEGIVENPDEGTLQRIHRLRREVIFMRKSTWPLRELIAVLERTENKLIRRTLHPYLRDVYEHTIQVIDNIESLRDMLAAALDMYVTVISNRTNDVMKVLTIIATIFIPLTFIAGIYGMNFEHMPELKWRFGYLAVWLAMGLVAMAMVAYFRRKKWF